MEEMEDNDLQIINEVELPCATELQNLETSFSDEVRMEDIGSPIFDEVELLCATQLQDSDLFAGALNPQSSKNTVVLPPENSLPLANSLNAVGTAETASISPSVFHGYLEEGRKRARRPKPETWGNNINKSLRMKGQPYLGIKKPWGIKIQKPSRIMGSPCKSLPCKRSMLRQCSTFSDNDREQLFQTFWNFDWSEKKIYVNSLIDKVIPKRKYIVGRSSRLSTYVYTLKLGSEKKQVCKNMFLSTLGIGKKQVQDWVNKIPRNVQNEIPNATVSSTAEVIEENPRESQAKLFLLNFLKSLPKMPSHYCRSKSRKLYLEPIIKSKTNLYEIYKEACISNEVLHMSSCTLDRQFEEMNLSLFRLKKDLCDICASHKAGNLSEEMWNAHQMKKKYARDAKSIDKKKAIIGECHAITMDLESVKTCPSVNTSSMYYKTKIIVHNFTIYDLGTHDTKCYWWDESDGGLVASTFASCVVEYLSRYEDNLPIVIYSDGCTYQNRNSIMSNALLRHAVKTNKTIYQKFLEKGHTQMESDSVHSAIETKLKNVEIYLPSDYIKICESARSNPKPYEAKKLNYKFFKDYSVNDNQAYTSICPGKKIGDAVVTDIRGLKYNPNGSIEYILDFSHQWKLLPHTPRIASQDVMPLYSARLPICKRKWKDLQELMKVIPSNFHDFYNNISFI